MIMINSQHHLLQVLGTFHLFPVTKTLWHSEQPLCIRSFWPPSSSSSSMFSRGHCRSLWTTCSRSSSAPVVLSRWLSNTSSTCWMTRRDNTASPTQRRYTFGRPTGTLWTAAVRSHGVMRTGSKGFCPKRHWICFAQGPNTAFNVKAKLKQQV